MSDGISDCYTDTDFWMDLAKRREDLLTRETARLDEAMLRLQTQIARPMGITREWLDEMIAERGRDE